MKLLTLVFTFFFIQTAVADLDSNMKLRKDDWKSNLKVSDAVEEDEPVRLPSQSGSKAPEVKPEKWEYVSPVDLEDETVQKN